MSRLLLLSWLAVIVVVATPSSVLLLLLTILSTMTPLPLWPRLPLPQMEYCENTLRHLIDNGELWKEEERCWRLFRQMLEGVDFIHSKGIIHR